jgi:SAM-dependent methyltransferase
VILKHDGMTRQDFGHTPALVADLPIDLEEGLAERLARSLDVEAKIPRTLEALGPVGGRDVLLLDGADGIRAGQLRDLGGRVAFAANGPAGIDAPDDSADVLVSLWGSFLGVSETESAEAARVLRPGGRLLIVLDYGRDDVCHLRGDLPEYGDLSRRDGPLLSAGSKVRVIHCFWSFATLDEAGTFLGDAFGESGREVAAGLKRPRLAYNVAVYHRTVGVVA